MIPDLALTLWQPHASLICPGAWTEPGKTIETRSWPCPPKHLGKRVLICSAKNDRAIRLDGWDSLLWSNVAIRTYFSERRGGLPADWIKAGAFPLGAALGVATIVRCLPIVVSPLMARDHDGFLLAMGDSNLIWEYRGDDVCPTRAHHERAYGDYSTASGQRFGWMLEDIVSFAEPIPVKGGQQLWRTDHPRNPNLRRQIAEALA